MIILKDIQKEDLESIMNWRMMPEITQYMNTNPKLTMEGQLKWLDSIKNNSDVRYWLIEIDSEAAGVINLTGLDREDGVIGWAYYVGNLAKRSMKNALALEMSMYDYALLTLNKNAVISDVFTLNAGVIALHKICGCEVIEEKKAAVIKEGIAYDVTYMQMSAKTWKEIRSSKKYEQVNFEI